LRPHGGRASRNFIRLESIMLGGLAKSLFGSSNDRYVKGLGAIVQ